MQLLESFKANLILKIVYWCARIGLGIAFVLSGTRKLPNVKFTALPIEDPVGAYFQTMYDLGFYWNFIGYFQIVVGIMVFFNRTVVISSVLMMPVTINIFLVSMALNMRGTPIITAAMVCGNLFLLLWHWKNYKCLFIRPI